jgi:DNA-binding MarR family transcriptional regulator
MTDSSRPRRSPQEEPVSAPAEVSEAAHPLDSLLRGFQTLQMNAQHVTSSVAAALGIGTTDLRALLFIATSGGATPKQTGDFLELTSGSVTNLIDRMVAAGFVERSPHPGDRRSLVLELAPEGTESVLKVVALYRRAFAESVEPDEVARMTAAFHSIGESLSSTADDAIDGLRRR